MDIKDGMVMVYIASSGNAATIKIEEYENGTALMVQWGSDPTEADRKSCDDHLASQFDIYIEQSGKFSSKAEAEQAKQAYLNGSN